MDDLMTIEGGAWKIGERVGEDGGPGRDIEREEIFLSEFKNLGRLDNVSRAVSVALARLLGNTNLYPSCSKLDIPVILSSDNSLARADIEYFKDFIDYGESAGRANLFVYTLPTSPLADASVHFGLTAGIEYVESSDHSAFNALLENVRNKVAAADVKGVAVPDHHILVVAEENEDEADALAVLLSTSSAPNAKSVSDAALLGDYATIAELKQLIFHHE